MRSDLKVKALPAVNIKILFRFLILSGLAVLFPAWFHNQWITGPLINAILFLSVYLIGSRNALLICLLPSVIALYFGLLPSPLAPLVPFIMFANVLLVITFDWLKNNYWVAVVVSALIKFLFLYLTSSAVINLILKKSLSLKISQMLSWPQLVTALLGGIIVGGLLKVYKLKSHENTNY